jgi:hypothetical protein
MSKKPNSAAVIGIDIGKNSFHIVGQNKCGTIVLRQKWSRGQVEARLSSICRHSVACASDWLASAPASSIRSARFCWNVASRYACRADIFKTKPPTPAPSRR